MKIILLLLAIVLSGCGGGPNDPSAKTIIELASITLTPTSASLSQGTTATFTATGTYNNGFTADITSSVAWASASSAIAAVATGVVTGVSGGSTTVSASLYGISATAADITVVAATPTLSSISITPASY
jgi:uncharacterized protein YjdB